MIGAVLKFVLPVVVASVGGATILGITSSIQTQPVLSSSEVKSVTQEQVREGLPSSAHTERGSTLSEHEQHKKEQEGNCQIISGPEGIISKLPSKYKYVAFSCQNQGSEDAVLTRWSGFFPDALFDGGSKALSLDKKFSIEVNEGENEDIYDEEEAAYKTIFTSQKFLNGFPIIGKWSAVVLEDTGDEYVYKVRLDDKPNSVDYLYLTYKNQ